MDEHPGGDEVLLAVTGEPYFSRTSYGFSLQPFKYWYRKPNPALDSWMKPGKDATADFEDIGHSDSAREMMEKYHIGQIDASTIPAKRTYVNPQQVPQNMDNGSDFLIKILQFLVPILILGLAFGIRQYTKSE